jgi:F1F0 ATPase subunit 2
MTPMSETLALTLACVAGAALGAIFFGGLWWTVRVGASAQRPALWFAVSALSRTTIVLAGFYFVAAGHWERMALCLAGFVVGRAVVMRSTVPSRASRLRRRWDADHAP